jgi:cytolysin-activating lysine-acyltransferase
MARSSTHLKVNTRPLTGSSTAEHGQNEFFAKVGIVASLMGASTRYCIYPVACIALWLEPAIRHDQLYIFRNESGTPIGYITWAWLAADTEHRLVNDPDVLLHISEWNEGDRLWILDFVLISGDVRSCIRQAAELFKQSVLAKSARRNDDGTVRRVTTWRLTALKHTSHMRR